jgi:PEP-CTERM motif
MRRLSLLVVAIVSLAVLPKSAEAALITGDLQFTGAVQVTAFSAVWYQFLPNINHDVAQIVGSTIQNGGVTVAALQPPNTLHETDLTAATPAGVPLNVDLFEYALPLTTPTVDFVLNFVLTCPQLGPQYTCLGASPFGFIPNNDGSTTIALSMRGVVFDTATPLIQSNWTGLWTTNVNMSINQIFSIIESGGTISNSYSATKITTVPSAIPEPATLLTFGAGSAILARMRRRKKA